MVNDQAPIVVVEHDSNTVLIGFDRPEVRNALDEATIDALHRVLDRYANVESVLVFHSTTEKMFVAGADIAELRNRDASDALRAINAGLFERIEQHRWPTIAAVDGFALGGGCELAMACDLRMATARSRFGQPELGLGIIAGAGANWRLAQLCGVGVARRLLYTGKTIDGSEALAIGLVDDLVEPEDLIASATELAATIATKSWRALEFTKLALRQHRPATTAFDVVAQSLLFESDDKRNRMDAFLDKRNQSRQEKT